jgi:hypothetical protein
VRLLQRIVVAAAVTVLPAGVVVWSCGTDANGIRACRQIQYARCNAAPACSPGFDTDRCMRFYRDECLVGIENPEAGSDPDPQPCVDAINLALQCVPGGDASPGECQSLIPDAACPEVAADAAATACNVILNCPEVLAACSFVQTPQSTADGGATDADASLEEAGELDGSDAATD